MGTLSPLTLASDMTVWNVTDEQVVVREAFVDENVAPTGTTAAYRSAKREPPSVAEKYFTRHQRWQVGRLLATTVAEKVNILIINNRSII